MTILILGGTAEARSLARTLTDQQREVISSLAGRVTDPVLPAGPVRIGRFGGVEGLQRFLGEQRISAVVDATHPFAVQISGHAATAAGAAGCRLIRLQRPGWRGHPDAERWTWVTDSLAAVTAGDNAERPFLTTGRQSLEAFRAWRTRNVLVRVVDLPAVALPERWSVIRSRGPYNYRDERRLMQEHDSDLLVTKDSGGRHTVAKLEAAGDLGVPVVVIARPAGAPDVTTVDTVEKVLAWLSHPRAG